MTAEAALCQHGIALHRHIVKLVISKPFDVDEFTKAILKLCADAHTAET